METKEKTNETILQQVLKKVDTHGLFGTLWKESGNFALTTNTETMCFEISCTDGLQWDFQYFSSQLNEIFSIYFCKEDFITEIKIFKQKMRNEPDKATLVFHAFMVFKTTNKITQLETWWSVEKDTLRILVQRSQDEIDVAEWYWIKEGDWKKSQRPTTMLVLEEKKGAGEGHFVSNANVEDALIYLLPMLKQAYTVTHYNCHQFVSDFYKNITGKIWHTPLTKAWQKLWPQSQNEVDLEQEQHEFLSQFRALYDSLRDEDKTTFDTDMHTFFFVAFKSNWPASLIKYLLNKKGFDPKAKDIDGRNLFMVALTKISNTEIFFTLKQGTDLAAEDSEGNSIVHCSSENSDPGVITYVINLLRKQKIRGILNKANRNLDNPLHYAIKRGHGVNNVKELLKVISHNDKDGDKNSPLHIALEKRNPDIARILIDNGCSKYAKGKNRKTPYDLAIESGYDELAKLLSRKRDHLDEDKDDQEKSENFRTPKIRKLN